MIERARRPAVWAVAAVALGGALALSCSALFTTKIGDILANPARYQGKKVTISGTVTSTVNIFLVKFFKVKDPTGEIAVVSDNALPREGDHVRVRGKVNEAAVIGSQRLLVVVEDSKER